MLRGHTEPLRNKNRPLKWLTCITTKSHVLATHPFFSKSTFKTRSDHLISPAPSPTSCHASLVWSQMFNHKHIKMLIHFLIAYVLVKIKYCRQCYLWVQVSELYFSVMFGSLPFITLSVTNISFLILPTTCQCFNDMALCAKC